MKMYDWVKRVFDAPSKRRDVDYSKEISQEAKIAVVLLYKIYLEGDTGESGLSFNYDSQVYWMKEVIREMGHLHHSVVGLEYRESNEGVKGLVEFLLDAPTVAFLDFLEVSLRNRRAPNQDNDFVNAVNHVFDMHDSPYLLTPYIFGKRTFKNSSHENDAAVEFPRVYLKQDTAVQKHALEPTLEIFLDPSYRTPAEDFRTALDRQKNGDYDGCVTSCAAAVEGTIKVVAAKNRWKVKGAGLDKLAQSFLSKSSLPSTIRTSFRPLSDWRNTKSDAHGHANKEETTEELARHFLAIAASLIVMVHSEAKN